MDHYIEAKLLPDPEFTVPLLMGVLYNKLHRALVSMASDNLGVSFPYYKLNPKSLGDCIRVHGSQEVLSQLMKHGWLNGMRDHLKPIEIQVAPETGQFVEVKRKHYKTSAERLRRRRMKRKGETYEQACLAIPKESKPKVEQPFVTLRSQSTGQGFALFIDQQVQDHSQNGKFNSYGLSQGATVPWF